MNERKVFSNVPEMRGYKTQDDFEYDHPCFSFFVLSSASVKEKKESRKEKKETNLKDKGDSFLVGEIGD